jgi:uncharacterized protein YkwD
MSRRLALLTSLAALLLIAFTAAPAQGMKIRNLMAPPSVCPGQNNTSAPVYKQERAMHCMTNFARRHAHIGGFSRSAKLDSSAGRKSLDILRCDSFSHYACGRDFTFWLQRVDYIGGCWNAGENIAYGTGDLGSVRSVFRAWMHSTGHRQNILSNTFSQLGVGLRVGTLDGNPGARVWVQHFGDHC